MFVPPAGMMSAMDRVDRSRRLSPIRMLCSLLAFSAPAIFALGIPEAGPEAFNLAGAVLVVGACLAFAIVLQRWRAPLVSPSEGSRRRRDDLPVGPWHQVIPRAILSRARLWGLLAGLGCLLVVGFNAAAVAASTGTLARSAHSASMLGALVLAFFAFRSRVEVIDGQCREYGVHGDALVPFSRGREVVVSRLGVLEIWALQLDDGKPRGYVVGRCARLSGVVHERELG